MHRHYNVAVLLLVHRGLRRQEKHKESMSPIVDVASEENPE